MYSEQLPEAAYVAETHNDATIDVAKSSHSDSSKEKSQGATEGPTTIEISSDAEVDVSLPLNWSARKKFLNMAVPSFICFVV
jgi:hypothetical protein